MAKGDFGGSAMAGSGMGGMQSSQNSMGSNPQGMTGLFSRFNQNQPQGQSGMQQGGLMGAFGNATGMNQNYMPSMGNFRGMPGMQVGQGQMMPNQPQNMPGIGSQSDPYGIQNNGLSASGQSDPYAIQNSGLQNDEWRNAAQPAQDNAFNINPQLLQMLTGAGSNNYNQPGMAYIRNGNGTF